MAVAGLVDFATIAPRDRKTWIRVGLLARELRAQDDAQVALAKLFLNAGALSRDGDTSHYWRRGNELIRYVRGKLTGAGGPASASDVDAMADAYVARFGDPADPAFQEQMRELLEHWASEKPTDGAV